jgi:hypothetical protein
MQKVVVSQAAERLSNRLGRDPKQDSGEPMVGDMPSGQQSYSVESFPARIG